MGDGTGTPKVTLHQMGPPIRYYTVENCTSETHIEELLAIEVAKRENPKLADILSAQDAEIGHLRTELAQATTALHSYSDALTQLVGWAEDGSPEDGYLYALTEARKVIKSFKVVDRGPEMGSQIARLRAALAEAERERDAMHRDYLRIAKGHDDMHDQRDEARERLAEAERERDGLRAQLACRADTDQCVMDEEPEIPCDEKNCRYMQIVARADRAEADLAAARELIYELLYQIDSWSGTETAAKD